ncbi:PAS domain-containing sensor histidine kinase [Stappia taiwanensis]|uniref:histidine kinase n=1 Tax=Stappia taiwanensis TaxID=992267 RepID=A0A838XS82_9HYPH|nr:PAS domain-containing sensor histidine kinase [Stappia taiwanensis]MBA4613182.1 PAS domain-containing sensor histidine kinase [Stappia taiwanensis]
MSDDLQMERGGRNRRIRKLGLVFVIAALISITATFFVLMGVTPIAPDGMATTVAMIINGILVAGLLVLIALEFISLLQARRRGRAAARLHGRIVTLFSVVAAVPAVLVAILATITLDRGLDRWFEDRTRLIIDNALTVAQAYLQEHARVLRGELIAMANDVDRAKTVYDFEPTRFDSFFQTQTSLRSLLGAFLMRSDGTVITRVIVNPDVEVLPPPPEAFGQADGGEPVLIAPGISNLVGGVMKLSAYDDMYLYVARAMDKRVVDYMRLAQEGASQYTVMEQSRFGVQVAFALVYTGVTLVLLLSSVWIGFGFANMLVSPIRRLIGAADQVSKGNLYVQVETDKSAGDLANLGATFNNMTAQLRGQREALLAANDQIDRRRRFTEAVLSGVTAGVIGVDDGGRITLVNRSALALLDVEEDDLLDQPVGTAVPELAEMLGEVLAREDDRMREEQISLHRQGRERTINVRVTSEQSTRSEHGFVVTLDDITDLVSAQRTSAWADVARRIAHEIKNPLTPIQLSAERIRRRYGKKITDDRTVFDQCVDTIIRQVGDIGRMVDEFSSFARMPKPTKSSADLRNTVREAAFLQTVANPDISISTQLPEEPARACFDARLVGQALTNVIKNAAESVSALPPEQLEHGRITVTLRNQGDLLAIEVVDNGIGLPVENRQRLLEPYMTTREKGTGLGLAIVKKIMEEHGGGIELLDAPANADGSGGGRGAMVRLTMATERQDTATDATDEHLTSGTVATDGL